MIYLIPVIEIPWEKRFPIVKDCIVQFQNVSSGLQQSDAKTEIHPCQPFHT